MAFTRFSARDSTTISNGNLICNNPSILRCPQAIESLVLVVLLFGIIIFIWRMGCFNKRLGRKKTTTGESNSKEDHPLSLPYPQPPSERYEATKELEPNNSTSTLVDPYLVTKSFDNSLISQDESFKRMPIPEPVLKWKKSVNHSALEPMVAHKLQLDPTTDLHDDDDDIKESITYLRQASPPPAYVRNPRSGA